MENELLVEHSLWPLSVDTLRHVDDAVELWRRGCTALVGRGREGRGGVLLGAYRTSQGVDGGTRGSEVLYCTVLCSEIRLNLHTDYSVGTVPWWAREAQ